MEFREAELNALIREASETKRNTLIVLFSSTLLLFWWLGDLVFPIFYDRNFGGNLLLIITITMAPLLLNMMSWAIWGFLGQRFNYFYSSDKSFRSLDSYDRYELALSELYKNKKIERFVHLLSATQFVIMGLLLLFGFMFIRIGIMQ